MQNGLRQGLCKAELVGKLAEAGKQGKVKGGQTTAWVLLRTVWRASSTPLTVPRPLGGMRLGPEK